MGTDGGRWLLIGNKEDMNWKRFLGGDAIWVELEGMVLYDVRRGAFWVWGTNTQKQQAGRYI